MTETFLLSTGTNAKSQTSTTKRTPSILTIWRRRDAPRSLGPPMAPSIGTWIKEPGNTLSQIIRINSWRAGFKTLNKTLSSYCTLQPSSRRNWINTKLGRTRMESRKIITHWGSLNASLKGHTLISMPCRRIPPINQKRGRPRNWSRGPQEGPKREWVLYSMRLSK